MTDLPAPAPPVPLAGGMEVQRALAAFLAEYQTEASRKTMRDGLNRAARVLSKGQKSPVEIAWHELRREHVALLRTLLMEQFAVATVNATLSAVKALLLTCWRCGLVTREEYARATDVKAVREERLPRGRMLTPPELRSLFAAALQQPSARLAHRDCAILALMLGGGLRAGEVASLDVSDFDGTTGQVTVRFGKGRKQRLTYLSENGRRAVNDWLVLRGDCPGVLITGEKTPEGVFSPLSRKGIYYVVTRTVARAELLPASPHDLRRTCFSVMLDNGEDISTVQRIAGHADVKTTQRYDRRGEDVKRRAAEGVFVPYEEGCMNDGNEGFKFGHPSRGSDRADSASASAQPKKRRGVPHEDAARRK